jgi:hypothetical protein
VSHDSDFYGVDPDALPAFVGIANNFISSEELPEKTRVNILDVLGTLRDLNSVDPLAVEAAVRFLVIQIDNHYGEGTTPPSEL